MLSWQGHLLRLYMCGKRILSDRSGELDVEKDRQRHRSDGGDVQDLDPRPVLTDSCKRRTGGIDCASERAGGTDGALFARRRVHRRFAR